MVDIVTDCAGGQIEPRKGIIALLFPLLTPLLAEKLTNPSPLVIVGSARRSLDLASGGKPRKNFVRSATSSPAPEINS